MLFVFEPTANLMEARRIVSGNCSTPLDAFHPECDHRPSYRAFQLSHQELNHTLSDHLAQTTYAKVRRASFSERQKIISHASLLSFAGSSIVLFLPWCTNALLAPYQKDPAFLRGFQLQKLVKSTLYESL